MQQLPDLTIDQIVFAAIFGFIIIALIGVVIWFVKGQKKTRSMARPQNGPQITATITPPPAPLKLVTIAQIEEQVAFSGGGIVAVLLLVLCNLIAIVSFVASTTILQETLAALVWIGWNILWGTGAIIGRKRTYIVRREAPGSPQS
jgi:hypothetical protein